jgi:hypothetical protein
MTLPKIKSFKPTGNQILVELLNEEEIVETSIELVRNSAPTAVIDGGAPQAYILSLGPIAPKDWGFKVGDRVIFSGNLTPCPQTAISRDTRNTLDVNGKPKRARGTLAPHAIMAVLEEKK